MLWIHFILSVGKKLKYALNWNENTQNRNSFWCENNYNILEIRSSKKTELFSLQCLLVSILKKTYAGKLCELQVSKAFCLKEENKIFTWRIRDVLWLVPKDYIGVAAQNSALTFLYPILRWRKTPLQICVDFTSIMYFLKATSMEVSNEEYPI